MKHNKLITAFVICTATIFAITAPSMVKAWRQKQALQLSFASYTNALVHSDFRKAYEFGGSDFRSALSYEEFVQQQMHLIKTFGNLSSIDVQHLSVEGRGSPLRWRAQVEANQRYSSETISILYEFKYEDGRWVLYGYKQI